MNRNTARYWGLVLAIAVAGLLAAALQIAARSGFGSGDLKAFAVWLAPLALLVPRLAIWYADASERWPFAARVGLGAAIGVGAGALWTLVPATMLGPWFGAFSFPVGYCFMIASIAGMIAPLMPRSAPRPRRGGLR